MTKTFQEWFDTLDWSNQKYLAENSRCAIKSYDKNGKEKKFDKQTTNLFIRGDYQAPADVTVIGGKTGTTSAAGHCLMLLARNVNGAPYIAVVMGVPSTEELYMDMIALLDEIQ